jgi:hypothetical protein
MYISFWIVSALTEGAASENKLKCSHCFFVRKQFFERKKKEKERKK